MNPKTEDLLYMLLWTCEMLSRPTWRNLTESFEAWAYRNGFLRQLQRLEQKGWLEHQPGHRGDRIHRLSQAGHLFALGGSDPEARWNRRWDGRWRLVIFDVPENRTRTRNQLRRYLRSLGYGHLQNSAWITPDPVTRELVKQIEAPVDVQSLLFLEARPCAGESDAEIVAGAWDFVEINRRYAAYAKVLARRPVNRLHNPSAAAAFYRWLQVERQAWQDILSRDPLLPKVLLPPDYPGQKIWRHRFDEMSRAGAQMRSFSDG